MSSPKRATREAFLHIACTQAQKERIKHNAKQAGAKSLTEYALTLLLKGDTEEFGFLRRKADGALVTADVYRQLRDIAQRLKSKPDMDEDLLREAIAIVSAVGRDIALARLANQVEQSM